MTNEERALWNQTWQLPHMQTGLQELKDLAAVKGQLVALPPGQDALVLAASAHWFASGQANILAGIEALKLETKTFKPVKQDEMFIAPQNRKEE